jgi:hypothetical protein
MDEACHAAEPELAIRNLDHMSGLLKDVQAALRRIEDGIASWEAHLFGGAGGRSEIPVNIADLGLVCSCLITPLPQGGNKVIS